MSDGRQAVPVRRAQLGYHHDADGSPPLNDATKTVTLYANGNEHFHGRPVVVSRRRTRTWDSFLAQATQACIHCACARDVLYMHRVKCRHRMYGHDTKDILSV